VHISFFLRRGRAFGAAYRAACGGTSRACGPPYRGRFAAMFTNRGGGSAPPSSLRSPRRPPVRAAPSPIALMRVGSPPAKCVCKRWGRCSVSWIVCASEAERVFSSWCSLCWLIRLNVYKRCSPPSRLGREGSGMGGCSCSPLGELRRLCRPY